MKTFASALLASSLAVPLAGCSGNNGQAYGAAAAGLATGVTLAGINRAVTGDCWARCQPGWYCDRPSGTCEPLPCSSFCPADKRCAHVDGKDVCVQPGGASAFGPDSIREPAPADGPGDGGPWSLGMASGARDGGGTD